MAPRRKIPVVRTDNELLAQAAYETSQLIAFLRALHIAYPEGEAAYSVLQLASELENVFLRFLPPVIADSYLQMVREVYR